MSIVLYNINSFGGNYEYSKELWSALEKQYNSQEELYFVLPSNAPFPASNRVLKILASDIHNFQWKPLKKAHFLFRSLYNPIVFWFFLLTKKRSSVIFNDFEQLTSVIWVPLFKLLSLRHKFGFIVHDPDRDRFFANYRLSVLSMKLITWVADIIFYHEMLPDKKYYVGQALKVSIPHGIYHLPAPDDNYMSRLGSLKGTNLLMGILGNIRPDKNYDFILSCLQEIKYAKLLVAGKPGNSSVNTRKYHDIIRKENLAEKVIWDERYLNDSEFSAAIASCDVILLYYGENSISQSGILNIIAPYKKHLLISDIDNPIKFLVKKFNLGSIVKIFDRDALLTEIRSIQAGKVISSDNWASYTNYASWTNNINIIVSSFKSLT